MSDVLKELQVALSLDTKDFSSNTKKMNNHINEMQARFKTASQTISGFENSFTGLNAKMKILDATMQKNRVQLTELSNKLAEHRAKNDSLKQSYEQAKTTYENNVRALEKLKNEGRENTEEFSKLQKEVDKSKSAFFQAESAYKRNETQISKLSSSIAKTEGNIAKLGKQQEDTKNKFNALSSSTKTFEQKMQSVAQKTALMESKMRLLSSQLGVNATATQKLKVEETALASKMDLVSQKVALYSAKNTELVNKKSQLEGKITQLNSALLREQQALDNAKSSTDSNAGEVSELEGKVLALKDSLLSANQELDRTTDELNQNNTALNNNQAELNETTNRMTALRGQMASLPFEQMSAKLDSASNKFKTVGQGLQNVGRNMSRYVTLPIVGLGATAVKTSIDFESGMSNVQAISGATGEDLAKLTDKAREMGKLTSKSAKDSADGLSYMALAGWKTEEMLVGLEPILRLSEAGNLDLARASDLATDSLSAMGKDAGDLGDFLDVVTMSSTTANTSIEQLLEAFIVAGPVTKQLGVDTEGLSGALSMLANNGVKGSEAGKAMSTILSRMSKPTKEVQKSFNALNIDLFDSKGKFKGLDVVLGDLNKAFSGLTQEQKLQHATSIAGKNYLSQFLMLVDSGDGTIQKYTESLYDADGALNKTAKTMKDNAKGNMETLKSAFEEMMIVIGDKLVPHINKFVIKLTDMINKFSELDPELQENIIKWAGIAAVIAPVLMLLGKLSTGVGTVLKGFSLLSGGIGKLVAKFATTQTAIATTTGAMSGVSSTAMATGGVFTKLAPLLTNPWVLAGAAVVGTTAVVISETKKQKKNIEKMANDAKESVHGLEKRYEDLSTGVEKSVEKIRKSNSKWMTPEVKANLTQDMKDIQNIITTGNGNAKKEMGELISHIGGISKKLTPKMKEEIANGLMGMAETFARDKKLSTVEAQKLMDELGEILGKPLKLNTDQINQDLKLEGIFKRMSEGLQKAVGWFGVNEWFGDIEGAARSLVSTITKEFEGMENIDVSQVFSNMKNDLNTLGASSKEQAEIIKGTLKPALVETFGGEGAAQYINSYVDGFYSASEAPKALTDALIEANSTYGVCTLEQQVALDAMNSQLVEKLGVQGEIMSGSVQNMLQQSSEGWAGIVSNQLLASDNMEADLTNFTAGAVAQIANMNGDLQAQTQAAEWFNTFITRLYETGTISGEQANKMSGQIAKALNKEVITTSKLDSKQFDNSVTTSLKKISELTGKVANPASLLDDKKFNETEKALKDKIKKLTDSKAKPKVIAEANQALTDLQETKKRLDALKDKTITVREKRITEYQTIHKAPVYTNGGSGKSNGAKRYVPQVEDIESSAFELTKDVANNYQLTGGYYTRGTTPTVISPVESAILKAVKNLTDNSDKEKKNLTQNITINSAKQLSPREIARQTRLAGQQLIRLY